MENENAVIDSKKGKKQKMKRGQLKENKTVCRFFRWAKKAYAAFNTLHSVVEISRLCTSMVDASLAKSIKAINIIFEKEDELEKWSESGKSDEKIVDKSLVFNFFHFLLILSFSEAKFGSFVFMETNNNEINYINNNSRNRRIKRLRLFCCQNMR